MIDLRVHIPEESGLSSKMLAAYFRNIVNIFLEDVPIEYLTWMLDSDNLDVGLTWQLDKDTINTWEPDITQYLDDYLDFSVDAVFDLDDGEVRDSFDRAIYGGAIYAKSVRGFTIPKIENEYTIRLVIADAVWTKVSEQIVRGVVERIVEKTDGTYEIRDHRSIVTKRKKRLKHESQ